MSRSSRMLLLLSQSTAWSPSQWEGTIGWWRYDSGITLGTRGGYATAEAWAPLAGTLPSWVMPDSDHSMFCDVLGGDLINDRGPCPSARGDAGLRFVSGATVTLSTPIYGLAVISVPAVPPATVLFAGSDALPRLTLDPGTGLLTLTGNGAKTITTTTDIRGTECVVEWLINGAASKVAVNGTVEASGDVGAHAILADYIVFSGYYASNVSGVGVTVGEILIGNQWPDDATRTLMFAGWPGV